MFIFSQDRQRAAMVRRCRTRVSGNGQDPGAPHAAVVVSLTVAWGYDTGRLEGSEENWQEFVHQVEPQCTFWCALPRISPSVPLYCVYASVHMYASVNCFLCYNCLFEMEARLLLCVLRTEAALELQSP